MNTTLIQLSVFGNFAGILPNSENILALLKELSGFIPGSLKSLSINALTGQVENSDRIQMVNNSSGWRVDFQIDRINAVYSKPIEDDSFEFLQEKAKEGYELLSKAFTAISITTNSSRLAINSQFVQPTGIEKPAIPFFSNLPSYVDSEKKLKEWTITINNPGSIIIDNSESTNEILTCSLAHSVSDPNQHAIMYTIDINTSEINSLERFTLKQFETFLDYAVGRMHQILDSFRS